MSSEATALAVPHRKILLRDTPNGFGTYHDLILSSGATTSRLGDVFESRVTAYNFPRLTLFDRQVVGAEHRRDPAQIRRDGFEHFYLQVLRSGRLAGGLAGEEQRLLPGDAVLFDATLPQRTLVADADYVTVTLARDLVESIVPNARRLHGRILPRVAGSIGQAVLSLAREAPSFSVDAMAGGSGMIASLLGEVAGAMRIPERGSAEDAEVDMARRLRAELFIDANLGRKELDVSMVARGIGVSRSNLYRAFRAAGGVDREIVRRRVVHLKSLILRPGEARSIDALAHDLGFSTPSHCSRVFKQFYGLPPNRLRAELRGTQSAAGDDLEVSRLREWYRRLNLAA